MKADSLTEPPNGATENRGAEILARDQLNLSPRAVFCEVVVTGFDELVGEGRVPEIVYGKVLFGKWS